MTIEQKRMAIAEVYPYKKWSDKVDNMSDNQVIGVYNSFLKSGKLGPKLSKPYSEKYPPKQISILEHSDVVGDVFKKFGIHFCKGCASVIDNEGYCESCQDIIEAFGSMEAAMTEGLKEV